VLRRIALVLTVALFMVVMLAASAMSAMALPEAACNKGTENAHSSVAQSMLGENNPAHEHIPEAEGGEPCGHG
jgi:hypothetical protein